MSNAPFVTEERRKSREALDAQIREAEAARAESGAPPVADRRAGDISQTRIRRATGPEIEPLPAPAAFEPTWRTKRSELVLSGSSAAALQQMRSLVRAESHSRLRILSQHPPVEVQFDTPLSAQAERALTQAEARIAALDGPAAGAGTPPAAPEPTADAQPTALEELSAPEEPTPTPDAGQRAEEKQIEAALTSHPSVREATVIIRGEGDDRRVAAYVEPEIGATADAAALQTHVAGQLTDDQVPRAWVVLDPAKLREIRATVSNDANTAFEAQERLHTRARLISRAAADRVVAAIGSRSILTREEATRSAVASLGSRGFARERAEIGTLAGDAWQARVRSERITERAADVLRMSRKDPETGRSEVRVEPYEVLREIERRRAEIVRVGLEQRGVSDNWVLPEGQPRMQPGGEYIDVRSIACLRCGSTVGREDRRSHLHTDGSPKITSDGTPERPSPGDGKVCTPCWLSDAPMSVPELKLAQRQTRLLESTQIRYRPDGQGWDERATDWELRDQARRGLTPALDEQLDAPSPWIVQPSPAEVADRRLDEQVEREMAMEDAREKGQWDLPGDREADWWDLKFSEMFSTAPEERPEPSPEQRLRLETERLAETQRRLLAVVGVEDPALRRVLETQATVRLHLAQGGAIREAWEQTRGIDRAELRAVARNEVEYRFLAPEAVAHHRRLKEARGMALPPDMPAEKQAAIRARQVERILADLDVRTLVGRLEEIAGSANPETARAARTVLEDLGPALEDSRLQGAVAAGQLAPTARQGSGVFHSGIDEAVLPGERRGESHERSIDGWLKRRGRNGDLAAGEIRSARDLARTAGDLNPRREMRQHTPSMGELPWQLRQRDAVIASEVAAGGYTAPDRILAAIEEYRQQAAARGPDVGDPFGSDLRDRVIEAAARQSGFSQPEVDRLWEIHALAASAEDPQAFDQMMREAGSWLADPERNNDPARLRNALDLRTAGGTLLAVEFSDEDLELVARAEQAAGPYLDVLDQARAQWTTVDEPAIREQERAALIDGTAHPAVQQAAAEADPRVAEVLAQVTARKEFELIDPAYQAAMRQIESTQAVLDATREVREAAQRAWGEVEQTINAQFTNPEKLLDRVRGMNAAEVQELAEKLRTNPLALSANHPRKSPPRIPGINAAGDTERLEPHLKTVRARGVRGIVGEVNTSATERQARVAAVALETWSETRQRGEGTRSWAATQLGIAEDTPLAKVSEAAMARLAELKLENQDVIRSWTQLSPPPSLAQIERRLASLDPENAAVARTALAGLAEGQTGTQQRPARQIALPMPAMSP